MSNGISECVISELSVCNELNAYLAEVYSEYCDVDLLANKEDLAKRSEKICKELHEIYLNKERYDLHWAFKQANESILYRQEKINKKIEEKIPNFKEIVSTTSRKTKLRVKRIRNTFNSLSFLVSFIDIIISVALILLVTMLSQQIESLIESVLLNILFVGLIALVKVSLDRFVIIPRIDKWGWKMYLRSINLMKQISIRLISVNLVLEEALKRGKNNEELIELFLRGFDQTRFSTKIKKEYLEKLLEDYQRKINS